MRELQKTGEPGYRQRDSVEHEGYVEVHSAFHGEKNNQNGVSNLFERILSRDNLNQAYLQVVRNKGAAGVDGMTYDQLLPYLKEHREELLTQLYLGKYKPQPVLRVDIPKQDGGIRKLGIPTVIDRMLQQAINQVLQPIFEPTFSDNSFGFRPKRSAHQAIIRAKSHYEQGYKHVVDLDMKAYFDTVNHDKLMYFVEKQITDKRVLRLIRRYLLSGIMIDGIFQKSEEGTPQGGNLSPLLSNIYLNELDHLLEKRGHRFVRYADDCNIYVKSKRAGQRVMKSITKFLEMDLSLTVNREKSAVGSPLKRKFLGFCLLVTKKGVQIRPHYKAKETVKQKLRRITKRNRGRSIDRILKEIQQLMTGWINYYGIGEMKGFMKNLNGWLKRRIRQYIWKQWKNPRTKRKNLIQLGIDKRKAYEWSNTRKGYWIISGSYVLHRSLTDKELASRGYKDIALQYQSVHSNY
ncbi:group II intron reverse transcriptase/maturase [Oceanobacillus jeddahense]|uniref:Group II intron reverse transcriptase/maturase n=2 Tax=Oceanobacillus jeddahense TaxID=1462527 RepID=A0ABY5JNX0_9BACI|nr:group II intron reverse transcriptase/maturase [Oceanobacillus jeddahense]UUI01970.1 group II intron reverse transcriptase/maturase [Oceanobacillus jeddahense]UUI01995.1 group II intron reverse transcriptase/maturase [Oceanobacillus jeddahense]UUI04450.1 group II intron reverse transcriptase/maturase [Oceanobacillus jeddahense]